MIARVDAFARGYAEHGSCRGTVQHIALALPVLPALPCLATNTCILPPKHKLHVGQDGRGHALHGARNKRCPRFLDVFRRESRFDALGRRCAGLRNSCWPPHLAAPETFVPSTNALSHHPWASQGPTQDDASDRLMPTSGMPWQCCVAAGASAVPAPLSEDGRPLTTRREAKHCTSRTI
jgi:hypothetical protein